MTRNIYYNTEYLKHYTVCPNNVVGVMCILQKPLSKYRCADKYLARPTSRCILFDGENISFDVSLVIYINSNVFYPHIVFFPSSDVQNKQ
jgi:hypothetical protein